MLLQSDGCFEPGCSGHTNQLATDGRNGFAQIMNGFVCVQLNRILHLI